MSGNILCMRRFVLALFCCRSYYVDKQINFDTIYMSMNYGKPNTLGRKRAVTLFLNVEHCGISSALGINSITSGNSEIGWNRNWWELIPECSTSRNRIYSPTDEENSFENPGVGFSSDSYQLSMRQNQYDRDYNNILREPLW